VIDRRVINSLIEHYHVFQEIYEPPVPPSPPSQHKPSTPQALSIPPHSLVAFGLFLRLPGYAEVLLKEKRKAQCLLRLILGVTDDGEGGMYSTVLCEACLYNMFKRVALFLLKFEFNQEILNRYLIVLIIC